ncbi:hypothetical protein F1880_007378 [Penicillium rolfsii]|nr:hypothetical protein F1880_007378 [Penicillium rolfsii]
MALFRAKLSYFSTFETRIRSNDVQLKSIMEHQSIIIRQWEALKLRGSEMEENKGRVLSPTESRQLVQYEWRYKNLEKIATQN